MVATKPDDLRFLATYCNVFSGLHSCAMAHMLMLTHMHTHLYACAHKQTCAHTGVIKRVWAYDRIAFDQLSIEEGKHTWVTHMGGP